ncbi:hypothetical protein CGMCC3_g7238 [Colletotrichum fructicola]|nr:uncharacterized protein CGMCC3_g7238 [Colletotrichum fructicola]KAE9576955.1 hypothetical protein CGMCC3_g7238 [Colletotrichum fructicola]
MSEMPRLRWLVVRRDAIPRIRVVNQAIRISKPEQQQSPSISEFPGWAGWKSRSELHKLSE